MRQSHAFPERFVSTGGSGVGRALRALGGFGNGGIVGRDWASTDEAKTPHNTLIFTNLVRLGYPGYFLFSLIYS
jgi:hypothetical protein